MSETRPLAGVSDDELLSRLAQLTGQSRRTEAELVAHIAEVELRRLYAREASPSMFAYCTEVLHLSEAEAYLRICAARASREHPVLLDMLGDGRLHLSGIAKLVPHLTPANRDGLLARAVHRSKRQIVELVAELEPRPDVPDRVTRLREASGRPAVAPLPAARGLAATLQVSTTVPPPPQAAARQAAALQAAALQAAALQAAALQAAAPQAAHDAGQLRPDAVGDAAAVTTDWTASQPAIFDSTATGQDAFQGAAPAPSVEPLGADRYRVQFTASRELCAKLERLRALLPFGAAIDLASVVELAVTEKIERLEARRFAAKRPPRGAAATAAAPATPTSAAGPAPSASGPLSASSIRYIPAAVRRAVHERDGDRCSYRDDAGRRCTARGRLEFHHLHPFGMGGEHSVRNLRLVCHAHNAYLAEVDYGRATLSRYVGRAAPRQAADTRST